MTNINEAADWRGSIPMIARADKVQGGREGKVNVQAEILAARTNYLKNQLDAYNGLIKSGELPFANEDAARSAIVAGKVPEGAIFSIRSDNPLYWVEEFKNVSGEPVATGRYLPGNLMTTPMVTASESDPSGTIAGMSVTSEGQIFCVLHGAGSLNPILYYQNSNGQAKEISSALSTSALSRYFDGSNPDALLGLKDVINRVFGWWDLLGRYHGDLEHAQWDEHGRMYADLAVLGDMTMNPDYQNPDVALYVIDATGRILQEVPLIESDDDAGVDEKIKNINARMDVATRTDGLLKSEFFGLNFLSETRRALMMASAREGQFVINIIGNSWVHNEWNLPRRLTQVLQDRFGDAGAGFAGYNRNFAHPGRAFLIVQSGSWTEETVTTPTGTNFGPAGSQGVTSTAGAAMAFQSLTGDTSAAIYHNADSSVSPVIKIKYKNNVSGDSTDETQLTLAGTGVTRTELPAPPVTGNWTATLTLVSGTLAFCGIELRKSVPGVRVNKLGTGGSTWRQWTTLNRAGWVQGITPLAANLNILLESVNGAYSYDADAEAGYTTEMAGRVRSASAFSDVLIISPPQTLGTPTYSLRDFAYKLRGIAGSLKAGHIDLQPVFGQSLSDYNDSGKKYIVAADVNHPTYPAGQCVITETVLRAILSAF